jgi:hypothetical protein
MNRIQKCRATPFLASMLAFAMLFVLLPATVFATPPPVGTTGIWEWEQLLDGSISITGCTTPTGALTIPATLNANGSDRAVTEIGNHAFADEAGITAVTFPEGLVKICDEAFHDADGLLTIHLPDSLRTLGVEAFSYCDFIESVELNEGLVTLGNACFADVDSLKEVYIPGSVTEFGGDVFAYDDALVTVILAYGITDTGNGTFYDCSDLANVYLPYGLETIGIAAFEECFSLVSIDIPDTVTTIGEGAFRVCNVLTSVVLPQSLEAIDDEAFKDCWMLDSVRIYSGDVVFGTDCFANDLLLTPAESGYLTGVDESSTETYATDNGLGFTALEGLEPLLHFPAAWTALYGKTFNVGTELDLSGMVSGAFGLGDYRVYAKIDDGTETLIATVTQLPLAGPLTVYTPVSYTGYITIPADLSLGAHWLTVLVRDMNDQDGIPQRILFQVGNNPETGDSSATPWMLLVLAVAAAVTLALLRRHAKV